MTGRTINAHEVARQIRYAKKLSQAFERHGLCLSAQHVIDVLDQCELALHGDQARFMSVALDALPYCRPYGDPYFGVVDYVVAAMGEEWLS
jgi:hypothetical protein